MVEKAKQLRIFGQLYEVRAEVETINGLSAHAGQDLLLKYAGAVKGRAKKIYLVHGEQDAATVFMEKLQERGIGPFEYPVYKQTVEI